MRWAKTASLVCGHSPQALCLLPRAVKYQHASERAALTGDLELKRIGAIDLFKELVGGACSIFKEKESVWGVYYTLGTGWLPEEKECPPPQRDVPQTPRDPSCFLQNLPVLTGFFCSRAAPSAAGCPSSSPTTRSQTHKSSFPEESPPCPQHHPLVPANRRALQSLQ